MVYGIINTLFILEFNDKFNKYCVTQQSARCQRKVTKLLLKYGPSKVRFVPQTRQGAPPEFVINFISFESDLNRGFILADKNLMKRKSSLAQVHPLYHLSTYSCQSYKIKLCYCLGLSFASKFTYRRLFLKIPKIKT